MELNERLTVKVRPRAIAENIVKWKNYRITVLGDRVFRIEKSKKGVFRDQATQSIWFRDAEKQDFSVTEKTSSLEITTSRCVLYIRDRRKDCLISLDGKKPQKINNAGNLKGTYRTLDGCNGKYYAPDDKRSPIRLGNGVCSRSGVAVIDDSSSLSLSDKGEILPQKADGSDEYVFAFGNGYKKAVKALFALTGNTPLIPRFALGNWWSRYYKYTQDEYLKLIYRFIDNEVPLTVATIDMDWHWSDFVDSQKGITRSGRNTEYFVGKSQNIGWTGYSWNTELFPDYKRFLKDLKALGLKITLNIHPADGVRFWEDRYAEMAKAMGMDPIDGKQIEFDISDPRFITAYFDILHKPLEKDGVDFWWIDWQQGTKTKIEGLDPLWALNHYHYLDNASDHLSPLILSRYAGVGSHRYPLGFSGDTFITDLTLSYLPYFTLTASNIGYFWWSHDIGGHFWGSKDDEQAVRHIQFGVFSPINRLHCSNWETLSKEPWLYGNGSGEIIKNQLRLRHSMIPFLYSASYRANKEGRGLIEPVYYYFDSPEAYSHKNQYFFGSSLLVAPVTTKIGSGGYSKTEVFIPEGIWTDIFTGDRYEEKEGGKNRVLLRKLDSIPVLIKAGGILPLSLDKGNSPDNPRRLEIAVWRGNGKFDLFEDGREKGNEREFITTFISSLEEKGGKAVQKLLISAKGDSSVIPKDRTLKISFRDIPEGKISLRQNGKEIGLDVHPSDSVYAEFPYDGKAEYLICVEFIPLSKLDEIKKRTLEVLLRAEEDNHLKLRTYEKIKSSENTDEFKNAIDESQLSEYTKARLFENF